MVDLDYLEKVAKQKYTRITFSLPNGKTDTSILAEKYKEGISNPNLYTYEGLDNKNTTPYGKDPFGNIIVTDNNTGKLLFFDHETFNKYPITSIK